MGIPHKPTTEGHPAITRLQYDYFLQEFEAGMMPGEINFSFEIDEENELCSFGYSKEAEQPYWIRENKQTDEKRFTSSALLFSSPLFYGKSLRERWDEVVIYSIASQSLNDWLSYADHSVETLVSEPEDDNSLYINGVELEGFIDEDGMSCPSCGKAPCYLDDYDDYCCPYCNLWLTEEWWYDDEVGYFEKRPLEPELLWKPSKMLRFCQVQFLNGGKFYSYYCPDQTINKGDWVEVSVGKQAVKKRCSSSGYLYRSSR